MAPKADRGENPTASRVWRLIWELAGVVGVDPRPLTLRQLSIMAEARGRHDWAQTAPVLAMLANSMRDEKKKPTPWTAEDFNPHAQRDKQVAEEDDVGVEPLKCFLTDKSRIRKIPAKVKSHG